MLVEGPWINFDPRFPGSSSGAVEKRKRWEAASLLVHVKRRRLRLEGGVKNDSYVPAHCAGSGCETLGPSKAASK